jgi:alpha-ketoglutaric semialdehyde dehydrogenase
MRTGRPQIDRLPVPPIAASPEHATLVHAEGSQMSRSLTSVIAGEPVSGAPGGRITSTNPARTSEVVAEAALGDAGTFADAARAARAAQPGWADVPAPVRGRAIAHIGRLVEANSEALARLVTREIGKPYAEALGEVREIVDTCDFFLGEGRRLYGQTVPSEMPDKQLLTFRNPVGVVSVITAGNFPVAVPSWYLIPALLCGNTVVWKPADYSPACGAALFDLIVRGGGLPDGVLNLVQADGEATYAGLKRALAEGNVDKVGFTGSSQVGARIGELTGRHLQSACLELGGKNPMVVTPSADLDLAVEAALFAGFGTAGQRCTSLGTVIAHDSVRDDFLAKFDAATREAVIGNPAGEVLYGPMLDQKFAGRFEEYLSWLQPHHAVLGSTAIGRITAANPRQGFAGDPDAGIFYHPVIAAGVQPDDAIFRQETFGPLVGVTGYAALEEAIALANLPGYGLSSSIYTGRADEAFAFRRGVSAGMVSVNNSTSGAEAHLPFGGNGKSGNGSRQSGIWVLDQFTRWQSVNWDYSGRLQKAQMDVAELVPDESFRLCD